jgi:hypothetical protein
MMYESRSTPPLPRRLFLWRLVLHAAVSLLIALLSLLAGMAGYMYFEHLAWRDAFLNAAMLLGGMGPVNAPATGNGKLFAGCYALYAGLVFLIGVGIVLAPILHRLLHLFHWEQDQ